MVKTIRELKRELAKEKAKTDRAQQRALVVAERRRLRGELFRAKNPNLVRAAESIRKGTQKAGKLVVEQAQLIKKQQVREAEERKKLEKGPVRMVKKRRVRVQTGRDDLVLEKARLIKQQRGRAIRDARIKQINQRLKPKTRKRKPTRKKPSRVNQDSFFGFTDF